MFQPGSPVQCSFAAAKQDFVSQQFYLKGFIILLLESHPHSLAFLPQLIWKGLFFTKLCSIIQLSALFKYIFRVFFSNLYPPSTFSALWGLSFLFQNKLVCYLKCNLLASVQFSELFFFAGVKAWIQILRNLTFEKK